MKHLELIVAAAGKPQGSKNPYIVKGRVVLVEASKDFKSWRNAITEILAAEARATGWIKAEKDQPIRVDLLFTFEKPKSAKRPAHTTKPDGDKLARSILDAITKTELIWCDDSQATEIFIEKAYGTQSQIQIRISHVQDHARL